MPETSLVGEFPRLKTATSHSGVTCFFCLSLPSGYGAGLEFYL